MHVAHGIEICITKNFSLHFHVRLVIHIKKIAQVLFERNQNNPNSKI